MLPCAEMLALGTARATGDGWLNHRFAALAGELGVRRVHAGRAVAEVAQHLAPALAAAKALPADGIAHVGIGARLVGAADLKC
jgi:hypothetical protein